ncbi:hypothetical protein SLA2020_348140 [Shorea laevis]
MRGLRKAYLRPIKKILALIVRSWRVCRKLQLGKHLNFPRFGGNAPKVNKKGVVVTDPSHSEGNGLSHSSVGPSNLDGPSQSGQSQHNSIPMATEEAIINGGPPEFRQAAFTSVLPGPIRSSADLAQAQSQQDVRFTTGVSSTQGGLKQKNWKRRARALHSGGSQVMPLISPPVKRSIHPHEQEGLVGPKEKKGRGGKAEAITPTLAEAVAQPRQSS